MSEKELSPETLVVSAGRPPVEDDAGINSAISMNATRHAGGPIGYGRYGNENWSALEDAIGALEGGKTLIFSSGIAAISAVFSLLPIGSVITASHQGYSGVMTLLKTLEATGRIEVRYVNVANTSEVLDALAGTSLLWLESPTNPMLDVADLPTLIKAAKKAGVGVGVDNTFATPLNQNPLAMGADIVMHSVTKFISGHSDILMGSLSTNDLALFARLEEVRKFNGAIAGPFESWLALRGLRTLAIRLERGQSNALELATRLLAHPAVSIVHYPGLVSDPHHNLAKSFMKGFGAVFSFELHAGAKAADTLCSSSVLISNATSLGGVETLWERRRRWSGESTSVPESLIRVSVGCENIEDLWADIDQGLKRIK